MRGAIQTDTDGMLSIGQAATRLGLAPITVRQWIGKRRIGCVRLGRRVVIPPSEVERLLADNYTPPARERDAR